MRKFIFVIVSGLVALSAAGQEPNYELASRFSGKRVNQMVFTTRVNPQWFRHSDKFWYSWKTSEGTRYYIVDPAAGTRKEVFDMDRLAMQITEKVKDPFEAKHLPLKDLRLQDDKFFLFDVASTADSTYHFRYDIASGSLTSEKSGRKDRYPRFATASPDGSIGIYVKNHNLWWADSTSLRKMAKDPKDSTIVEHALTTDGTADHSWNGDNYSGDTRKDSTERSSAVLYWAPDGRHFATMRWDMSKVKELWVINSVKKPRPELETYKYQLPGEPGPTGTLYIFDMPSGTSRKVATHAFKDQDIDIYGARETAESRYEDYPCRRWLGDNDGFYLLRVSRDLKRHDLCYVGVNADSTHVVVKERSNTYVENRKPYFIQGGRQFIWWSERNGWANLYLYNADGTLVRNLTEGAYHVNDVLGVNEAGGYVLFGACGVNRGENPYQTHNFKVALSGGAIKQLDMPDMDVLATASYDSRYFVANYSRVDAKPAAALYDATLGRKVCELEEADFSLLLAAGYKFPERFKVKAADGITDLYGAMYKPFDFDSTKTYPIIDYVYPGPQVEANNISWSRGFLRLERLAQIGFVVITVGNRGGHPDRSKWYHNFGYGNMRDYGLEDQKYAIQQLAGRYSYIDGTRVGIHGHSGGGFMSTAAILTYPDFFTAAVSCAGNHDNSIYNRWWSEQHHGVLEKIEKGDTTFVYSVKTNQELASRLKGHLMLVTGDVDNNVNPANTIRVVDALIRANKRFDLLVLPGQRHGFGDMNEYFFWRLADYFSEWLLGSSKRWQPDIIEMNND